MSQLPRNSVITAESRPRQAGNAWLALAIVAFSPCATSFGRSALGTPAQFLARHGIALTKEGLIAALSNSDLWIRLNAGQQLVIDGEKSAIPFIRAAAAREPRPMSRLSLAFDLAQLGDQAGVDLLTEACSDTLRPAVERLFAAQETLFLRSDTCLRGVLSILGSNVDAPEVIQALNFLSGFNYLPGFDGVQAAIVGAAARRLGDDDPGVRIAASDVLSRVGDSSAAEALRQAILRETVEAAKREMQRDLETLEKKNR